MRDRRLALLALSLPLASCAADGPVAPVSSQRASIAIPGPWVPDALTRAAAASQRVPVVDPPAVSPLGSCTSTNPFACSCRHPACMSAYPGTRDLNSFLLRRYAFLRAGGTYCCRQNSARTTVPMLSVHATGRAIDLMVPMAGGDADNTLGDAVANWLVENATFIGIQRVVWDRAYWNGERGFGLLSSASLPHTDHLHIELSQAGAERRTAFFTSGASMGTCTARCDGTRLVNADCTSTDCASTGAPCLAGPPPRCGTAAPAEPAEAALNASATLPAVQPSAAPARLTLLGPSRVADTRTPTAATRLVRSGASGPLAPTSTATVRDWTGLALPAGTTGVWLNVAAIGVDAPGFVTAFSEGAARPPTSTVNYVVGDAQANGTPVVLGASGGVTFASLTQAHAVIDLLGAFSPTGAGLVPAGPTRVLDTRSDVQLMAGVERAVDVSAPAGATGVVANVTAIANVPAGFITAYPCGSPVPETSSVNFASGAVVTNTVVSALGGGRICLRANVDTHAVVDVTGFLTPGAGLTYTALTPQRLLDTRESASRYVGRLGARQVIELPVQRMPGMPANAAAVVVNLTGVSAATDGFVTAFPCGAAVPPTSSLNLTPARALGAVAVAALGSGSLCVFSNVRTHLIVDVLGVWTGATTPVSMPPPSADEGDDVHPEDADAGASDASTDGASIVDASTTRDGSSTEVPADGAASDVARVDASISDAATVDGALPDDAAGGYVPPLQGGCGCRAHTSTSRASIAHVAALALLFRRRRRTAKTR